VLKDLVIPQKVWPCKVKNLAATLTEVDRKIFLAAVMNPDWPLKTLENELRKRGMEISEHPLKKHRTGACACSRLD
jgi:hypothetical protein